VSETFGKTRMLTEFSRAAVERCALACSVVSDVDVDVDVEVYRSSRPSMETYH